MKRSSGLSRDKSTSMCRARIYRSRVAMGAVSGGKNCLPNSSAVRASLLCIRFMTNRRSERCCSHTNNATPATATIRMATALDMGVRRQLTTDFGGRHHLVAFVSI